MVCGKTSQHFSTTKKMKIYELFECRKTNIYPGKFFGVHGKELLDHTGDGENVVKKKSLVVFGKKCNRTPDTNKCVL